MTNLKQQDRKQKKQHHWHNENMSIEMTSSERQDEVLVKKQLRSMTKTPSNCNASQSVRWPHSRIADRNSPAENTY